MSRCRGTLFADGHSTGSADLISHSLLNEFASFVACKHPTLREKNLGVPHIERRPSAPHALPKHLAFDFLSHRLQMPVLSSMNAEDWLIKDAEVACNAVNAQFADATLKLHVRK